MRQDLVVSRRMPRSENSVKNKRVVGESGTFKRAVSLEKGMRGADERRADAVWNPQLKKL